MKPFQIPIVYKNAELKACMGGRGGESSSTIGTIYPANSTWDTRDRLANYKLFFTSKIG